MFKMTLALRFRDLITLLYEHIFERRLYMSNLELEKRVADLEKRVVFLYKAFEQQLAINQQLINDAKTTTENLINFSNAIENNSLSIGILSEMIKQEQES